jgi:hypothetical protein
MMHYKFMVLGDENEWKEVIHGSYNFTENANRNDEVIKVSTDKDDITHMVESFEALWPSKPLVSKINPWAAPSRPKPTPAQADDKLWLKLGSKPKSPPGSAPIHKLSLKHVVIAQHFPWDFVWKYGKDFTTTWQTDAIISELINLLFKYYGEFTIRREPDETGGVCVINANCIDGNTREVLVVKDDNNGTTYTISNHQPPKGNCGITEYISKDMEAIKHLRVLVAKDDKGYVDYIWVSDGLWDTDLYESLCANCHEWIHNGEILEPGERDDERNEDGLWTEGMTVDTWEGGGHIESIVEIWSDINPKTVLNHIIELTR